MATASPPFVFIGRATSQWEFYILDGK